MRHLASALVGANTLSADKVKSNFGTLFPLEEIESPFTGDGYFENAAAFQRQISRMPQHMATVGHVWRYHTVCLHDLLVSFRVVATGSAGHTLTGAQNTSSKEGMLAGTRTSSISRAVTI